MSFQERQALREQLLAYAGAHMLTDEEGPWLPSEAIGEMVLTALHALHALHPVLPGALPAFGLPGGPEVLAITASAPPEHAQAIRKLATQARALVNRLSPDEELAAYRATQEQREDQAA